MVLQPCGPTNMAGPGKTGGGGSVAATSRVLPAAVVMDNGSGYSKSGFASEDKPRSVIKSVVAIPRAQIAGLGYLAGCEMPHNESVVRKRPITNGVVVDWEAMEMLWHHIFYSELKVAPEDQPVLISDGPSSPTTNREKAAEVLFEAFSVPAMHMMSTSLLCIYSCGRTTGLAIESGSGLSSSSPVHEGYSLPHATYRLDVAGRAFTNYLMKLMAECGNVFLPHEKRTVRDIKRKCCYVALDYETEMQALEGQYLMDYQLPDGQLITIGNERFRCPEAIFRPKVLGFEDLGLQHLAYQSLQKVEADCQKEMMANVVVCGGSTMFPGFPERIQKELTQLCSPTTATSGFKVKVLASSQRKNSPWIGGSIVSSLQSFQNMWLSKKDYEEKGPFYVHHNCSY